MYVMFMFKGARNSNLSAGAVKPFMNGLFAREHEHLCILAKFYLVLKELLSLVLDMYHTSYV